MFRKVDILVPNISTSRRRVGVMVLVSAKQYDFRCEEPELRGCFEALQPHSKAQREVAQKGILNPPTDPTTGAQAPAAPRDTQTPLLRLFGKSAKHRSALWLQLDESIRNRSLPEETHPHLPEKQNDSRSTAQLTFPPHRNLTFSEPFAQLNSVGPTVLPHQPDHQA